MKTTTYIKTYFRISCGYEMGGGMNEDKYEFFQSEIQKIFVLLGFEIVKSKIAGASDTAYRNKESLYLHPQNFSGFILETSICEIEAAIKASALKLNCVDTYEVLYDADAEFLLRKLQEAKEAIREEIFEKHKTTRKTNFVRIGLSTSQVSVKLLDRKLSNSLYREFISSLVNEMVKQKLIKPASNHPEYYRSLNRTELRAWERVNGPAFNSLPVVEQNEEEENLFTLFDISY
ncbi:hypothetical protein ACOMCU_25200 [Lysinibacillus sp. UGB7]|uniref:hypothetical protein n=1 Tax=Lysinibacillus sp. UGB7 TaxID=3411039 RepID=UPI003B80E244